ncbi:MAG TPA: FAD-dependent 5-carboxymethylaminomethyl-2-thiouridine(34) oxidoreductase MnmC [Limnobacter sp.]|uniref:FAD-dependent 5-carboxymethylaminomethyl-2-thiouridine(34) oxidoreductase MnmC n=1 Tax=Limnobacter sp. TaxID=2003368 RepID=UPI002E31C6F8|nr:FAD-dependent 5-carboxymethylaminomethyl-2-thiouridine(34) oxidoreductase MnmC [Limnobacter sp.]HEX5484923.1 FAD-dependent 5-carboxymethylaminomethyl-2-thiouridine(34) oxidoreductase MnmC [Limnobacter sp.]
MNNYQRLKTCNSNDLAALVDTANPAELQAQASQIVDHLGHYTKDGLVLVVQHGLSSLLLFQVFRLWHERPLKQGKTLHFYLICEPVPTADQWGLLAQASGVPQTVIDKACAEWPPLTPGLHRLEMPALGVVLHLWFGAMDAGRRQLKSRPLVHIDEQGLQLRQPAHPADLGPKPVHRVAVLGAGIAGSQMAYALCQKGLDVHLFDRAAGPAQGASGNWLGAFHPHLTKDDTPLSRLSRFGHACTVRRLRELSAKGLLQEGEDWALPGHWMTFDAAQAEKARQTLEHLAFPEDVVQWKSSHQGLAASQGGYFFPSGGWVKPHRWVQASLQACAGRLTTHYGYSGPGLPDGFDATVVACAENSLNLVPVEGGRISAVKGQITKVRGAELPCVISGESYAISASGQDNWTVVGATYERPVEHLDPTAQADLQNIEKFRQAMPGLKLGEFMDHRASVRAVWPDRLPAIGPTGTPDVYLATAYASRGLLWAAVAPLILSHYLLEDEPLFALWERLSPLRNA